MVKDGNHGGGFPWCLHGGGEKLPRFCEDSTALPAHLKMTLRDRTIRLASFWGHLNNL